ncbi:hypothetical protein [Candidatus Vidania fulgoroideorum]
MNYIKFSNLNFSEYKKIFKFAKFLKKNNNLGFLKNKNIIFYFNLPSTRTKLIFEIALKEEKANIINFEKNKSQIIRGENLKDTISVFNNVSDAIVYRGNKHNDIKYISKYYNKPIFNALTKKHHPFQVGSDLFTYILIKKNIFKKKITFVGEKNNIYHSWNEAKKIFKFKFKHININKKFSKNRFENSIKNCDILVTDTWNSMGEKYKSVNKNYQIKKKHLDRKNIKFLHCLPAYVGKEVGKGVIRHKNSIIWDEIKNKKYFIKSLVYFILNKK